MDARRHGWARLASMVGHLCALAAALLAALMMTSARVGAHAPCTAAQSASKGLGEQTARQLPAEPLHWRLETFGSKAAAEGAAGPLAIPFEAGGRAWLATLGAPGEATTGGTLVADIGPLPAVRAAEYRLRVQQRVTQPGCEGDIHTHPGAEAWHMLAGEQTVVTPAGERRVGPGESLVGPPSGTPMQLAYRGAGESDALTFLLLDAAQPNSSPASLPAPGLPNTGAGGGASPPAPVGAFALGGLMLAAAWGLRRARRARPA